MPCPACNSAWLWLMSACPDLPPCSPGSKADSVLSPDPAPGLVPTLSSKSGGHPRLHLAPGFYLESSQIFGIHHPVLPPPGGSAHNTKQAQGQMGLGLSLGGWGVPHLAPTHCPPPGPARVGAPCQPQMGAVPMPGCLPVLAWCHNLNSYACR